MIAGMTRLERDMVKAFVELREDGHFCGDRPSNRGGLHTEACRSATKVLERFHFLAYEDRPLS